MQLKVDDASGWSHVLVARESRCRGGGATDPSCGGEGGIRTRDGLPRTAFPVRRHSPLGDLSRNHARSSTRRSGVQAKAIAEDRSERTHPPRSEATPCEPSARGYVLSEARRRTTQAWASARRALMAERAGFEPAVLSHTAFRERHHQPLGHLSAGEDTKGGRPGRPDEGPARPSPRPRRSWGSRPGAPRPRPAGSR